MSTTVSTGGAARVTKGMWFWWGTDGMFVADIMFSPVARGFLLAAMQNVGRSPAHSCVHLCVRFSSLADRSNLFEVKFWWPVLHDHAFVFYCILKATRMDLSFRYTKYKRRPCAVLFLLSVCLSGRDTSTFKQQHHLCAALRLASLHTLIFSFPYPSRCTHVTRPSTRMYSTRRCCEVGDPMNPPGTRTSSCLPCFP